MSATRRPLTRPLTSGSTRRWRPPLLLWIMLVLVLMLTGCGGSSTPNASSSSSAPTTESQTTPATSAATTPTTRQVQPPPPAPKPAECRNLTASDISFFSNTTKAGSCTGPHTAYTFAVPTLPAAVAFEGVQIKNDAVQQAAADKCRSAFGTFIGGDEAARALSRLTVTYFLPDQNSFDRGAHWVRCDVVALQSPHTLGDLPGRLAGFLDSPRALDTYGLCSTTEPGSAASLVMCSRSHTYRALAALRLGAAGATYPGQTSTLDAGKKRCKDLISGQLGRSGGFTYSWTFPSADDWAAGQRFGYCWNATTG